MTRKKNPAMSLSIRLKLLAPLCLATLVAGCVTPNAPVIQRNADATYGAAQAGNAGSLPTASAPAGAAVDVAPAKASTASIKAGTGQVINERVAASPPPNIATTGEATFNFEGESLHAVVKAILGDLLQQNYVIAPNVQGTVTLATPRAVSPAQALSLLEMVLGWNNARLIWSDGRYNVVPADQALAGNLSPRTGSPANARGYEVRAVPLKYISASEMEKLLKPYARPNAVVQVDQSRNLIVLAGTRAELQNYLRTVQIFDVDWLSGMSVGVFPLQSAEASKVVGELDKVFGEGGKTPLAGMFRFMPLEGQNAVMVITPQASYLRQVEDMIERMDAGGEGSRLFVYEVKYVKAVDLAEQLGQVYGSTTSSKTSAPSLMPSLEPVEVRTTDMASADAAPARNLNAGAPPGGSSSETISIGGGDVGISAVEESNSLLVRASPAQWESIRRAIERLDTMPLQVHVEAQVVEVKLTGELSYGVSWFFGNEVPAALQPRTSALDDWTNAGTAVRPSGTSNFTFLGPSAQAILTTLDNVSDLRVLSAPSVLVRNNVEADFSSGQQIPVASTILNNTGNSSTENTYSQVQFRQTGVSLKVKPRISSDGMVFMEITQDVSSPSSTGPEIGGNISVDNNKLHTEVAVQSGETIMLAGLIKTDQSKGSSGIPYLSRIPVIGALFGTQGRTDNRQEVLVLITPTVIRDPAEARRLTDEYGERFKGLEPLRKPKAAGSP
jgi:general secretion pathway protein D